MIEIKFNTLSNLTAGLQITTQLRNAIDKGTLREDDRLPAVRELADELGVHFNTVARAYRILAREGLVLSRPGQGTFILAHPAQISEPQNKVETLRDLTRRYLLDAKALHFTLQEIKCMLDGFSSSETLNI